MDDAEISPGATFVTFLPPALMPPDVMDGPPFMVTPSLLMVVFPALTLSTVMSFLSDTFSESPEILVSVFVLSPRIERVPFGEIDALFPSSALKLVGSVTFLITTTSPLSTLVLLSGVIGRIVVPPELAPDVPVFPAPAVPAVSAVARLECVVTAVFVFVPAAVFPTLADVWPVSDVVPVIFALMVYIPSDVLMTWMPLPALIFGCVAFCRAKTTFFSCATLTASVSCVPAATPVI